MISSIVPPGQLWVRLMYRSPRLKSLKSLIVRSVYFFLLSLFVFAVPMHAVSWFPLGPYGGDARSFAADPGDSRHLYLGSATGWIYESHNGGQTWVRLSQLAGRNDLVIDCLLYTSPS